MERLGPESLMVMAAGRISRQAPLRDRPLWELPMTEGPRAPELLAAAPVHRRAPAGAAVRGWLDRFHDWRTVGRVPRGF